MMEILRKTGVGIAIYVAAIRIAYSDKKKLIVVTTTNLS